MANKNSPVADMNLPMRVCPPPVVFVRSGVPCLPTWVEAPAPLIISDPRAGLESFPEMTNKVTTLVGATGIEDPGRMSGAGTERPDPEVPERARLLTVTEDADVAVMVGADGFDVRKTLSA